MDTQAPIAQHDVGTASTPGSAELSARLLWFSHRPAVMAISAVTCLSAIVLLLVIEPYRIDLDVYRIGAQAWLDGDSLYGQLPVTSAGLRLPFTYPPAAAVLLSPVAFVPFWAANAIATAASLSALVVLLALSLRRSRTWRALSAPLLALLAASLLVEPVQATLGFGQVNLVLAALVALDVVPARTWWPRGVLIGVAAAVKLTPAVFVLALLVRRQYREAATAGLAFTVVTLVAWVLAPQDSEHYWTEILWNPSRIGGATYAGNQSIHGVLLRLGLSGEPERVLWLACTAALAILAWVGMRDAARRGEVVLVLGLNAIVALLASPISWTHHWVWLVPLCITMWSHGPTGRTRWRILAALGAVLMLLRPIWWLPREEDRELGWAIWQHLPGDAYVLLGLAILVVAALPDRPLRHVVFPYGAKHSAHPGTPHSGARYRRASRSSPRAHLAMRRPLDEVALNDSAG